MGAGDHTDFSLIRMMSTKKKTIAFVIVLVAIAVTELIVGVIGGTLIVTKFIHCTCFSQSHHPEKHNLMIG